MMLSLTNGRSETLSTTDIATAFLNAPIDDSKVMSVAVPHILTTRGMAQPGIVWKIRRAVYGLKENPRSWQEERYRVLEELT
eukprot:12900047-Prorocentrum_lima.AAC.1